MPQLIQSATPAHRRQKHITHCIKGRGTQSLHAAQALCLFALPAHKSCCCSLHAVHLCSVCCATHRPLRPPRAQPPRCCDHQNVSSAYRCCIPASHACCAAVDPRSLPGHTVKTNMRGGRTEHIHAGSSALALCTQPLKRSQQEPQQQAQCALTHPPW